MLVKSEVDIEFDLPADVPMIALLHIHPSLDKDVTAQEPLTVTHSLYSDVPPTTVPLEEYIDSFGNRCSRFTAPAGRIRIFGTNTLHVTDDADLQGTGLPMVPVEKLPHETLQFLLASRYCPVDQFGGIAQDLFGGYKPGWETAAAIRDWVNSKVTFNYSSARSTKTAMDVFTERVGVCRDFQHLAVTLTRCMNIPTRYVTGWLGDIRTYYRGLGDFHAWYQVWLDGKWWDMDARHNQPRYGRVLMATGRDAADVAITTSFGTAQLGSFYVEANELDGEGKPLPVPGAPAVTPPRLNFRVQ